MLRVAHQELLKIGKKRNHIQQIDSNPSLNEEKKIEIIILITLSYTSRVFKKRR